MPSITSSPIHHITSSRHSESRALAALEPQLFKLCRLILRTVPTPDQLQEARIAAVEALRLYDPAKGKFSGLLSAAVRTALFRRQESLIRIPEYQRTLLKRLDALQADYLFTKDRAPTDDEIVRDLDITPDQLELLHSVHAVHFVHTESEATPDPYEPANTRIDVSRALEQLKRSNPKAAQIARLHLLDGKPSRTIIALLRIGKGTYEQRLREARTFLRSHLAAYA